MEAIKMTQPVTIAHTGILNLSGEEILKMEPAMISTHPEIHARGLAQATRLIAARSTRWKIGNPMAPRMT